MTVGTYHLSEQTGIRDILLEGLTKESSCATILSQIAERQQIEPFVLDMEGKLLICGNGSRSEDIRKLIDIVEDGGIPIRREERDVVEIDAGDGTFYLSSVLTIDQTPEAVACVCYHDEEHKAVAREMLGFMPGMFAYFYGTDSRPLSITDEYVAAGFARELLFRRRETDAGVFERAMRASSESEALHFAPGYRIAVIVGADASTLRKIGAQIERLKAEEYHFLRGGRLYLLFYGVDAGKPDFAERLKREALESGLHVGVSVIFDHPQDCPRFRRQAALAAELAERRGVALIDAEKNYLDVLFGTALADDAPQIYRISEIARLREYDKENQTEYFETLEQYLKHQNRPSHTAACLHIDRGTLNHRLQKIREILHCDFDEAREAQILRYAFRIARGF